MTSPGYFVILGLLAGGAGVLAPKSLTGWIRMPVLLLCLAVQFLAAIEIIRRSDAMLEAREAADAVAK